MTKVLASAVAALCAIVLAVPAAFSGGIGASEQAPAATASAVDLAAADRVVVAARSQLGVPYVWGASTPGIGFDCSGLVQWAYAQAGIRLPRTTAELVRVGEAVGPADLQPGDLVFSRGGRPVHDLGHVAIYTGGDQVIVAPHTGARVRVQQLDAARVQAVRRVIPRPAMAA